MKKLSVDKEEGIADVIDGIIKESDHDITLVIPKESVLGKSASNFHLLRREADAAAKSVTIESVDDAILAYAKDSGLQASHPLWSGVRGGVSDIVPKETEMQPNAPAKENAALEALEKIEDEEDDEDEGPGFFEKMRGMGSFGRWWMWAGGALVALIIIVWAVGAVASRADISINFKKSQWNYSNNFVADKAVSSIGASSNVIPAQVFTTSKNMTQTFPASSFSNVSQKAEGTITIYNNFSSAPQDLVATTRFVTPDGKVFRITSKVTVPGAKSSGGKLVPSSVDAHIVADQAGPDYNLGPVPHLTIPGFQGTPRYTGFYGAIAGTTTGGSTGRKAVPTAADITAAKSKTTDLLQSALQGGLAGTYPNNFKILDGATFTQVTKLTVNTSTDANGNFSVFGEATMQAIGFDEAAFQSYLLSIAEGPGANLAFKDLSLSYGNVKANFPKGQITFALTAQGTLEPAFSAATFAESVAGKSISQAKDAISALPSLTNGKISVWPFWLWTIPSDPKRVHVTVD